jgi:hypothetical protein
MPTETTAKSVSEVVALLMEDERDPEKIAARLQEPFLPEMFLDDIDVSDDDGVSVFLRYLQTRFGGAEIEKDEVCRFVERNRPALAARVFPILAKVLAQAKAQGAEDDATVYIEHVCAQVGHALRGQPECIDTKSGRLFWLLFTLGHMAATGRYAHADATRLLSRSDLVARMTPVTLLFMLEEYKKAINTKHEQPIELVMLLMECALLARDLPAAATAFEILSRLVPALDTTAWVGVMERGLRILQQRGCTHPEHERFMQRLRSRFGPRINDDDL